MKIKILITSLVFVKSLMGLDTEVILKITKPINSKYNELQFFDVKEDGSFLAVHKCLRSWENEFTAIVMLKSGKKYSVNLIENVSKNESNGITTTTKTWRGRNLLLQTANEKGYLVDELTEIKTFPTLESWSKTVTLSNYRISKYDSNGVFISSLKLPTGKNSEQNPKLSVSFQLDYFYNGYLENYENYNGDIRFGVDRNLYYQTTVSNRKNLYFSEDTGDEIVVYRLTDADLLSSPNRITLGSSQNGSLTATVNNPEQSLLNIQSSTNLIDWNTFKTIKNEPSLEIVVPANQSKEFIRAIE